MILTTNTNSKMILLGLLILLGLAQQLFDKPHLFVKPINKGKVATISLFAIVAILAFVKGCNDDHEQVKSFTTIDSLQAETKFQNKLIDTLRAENKLAQKEYEDSLKYYSARDIKEVDSTAFTMTKIFAENSNVNLREHLKTQGKIDKIDTLKRVPANIGFILEPHNVFTITITGDQLYGNIKISNFGDGVAYDLKSKLQLILRLDGNFYSVKDLPIDDNGFNLMPNGVREVVAAVKGYGNFPLGKVEYVYGIVKGSYYLNDNKTGLKTFQMAIFRDLHNNEAYQYNLKISIDSLIKSAKTGL